MVLKMLVSLAKFHKGNFLKRTDPLENLQLNMKNNGLMVLMSFQVCYNKSEGILWVQNNYNWSGGRRRVIGRLEGC